MKIGDLVTWDIHPGYCYQIINEKVNFFEIELYHTHYYQSRYWVQPKKLSLLTPEQMSKIVAKRLLK